MDRQLWPIGHFTRRACTWMILLTVLAVGYSAAQVIICPCDTADGWTVSWGQSLPEKRMEVNSDKRFVTDGDKSLHVVGSVKTEDGNQYLGFKLKVQPFDLQGKALFLDAATSTPKVTNAFYLRLYDDQGKLVASWNSWGDLLKDKTQTFRFIPGGSKKGMAWEQDSVKSDRLDHVATVELIIGTKEKNVTFDGFFDNLRTEETNMRTMKDVTAPKKLYPSTTVIENGKPSAAIVAPQSADMQSVVESFRKRLQEVTGLAFAVVDEKSVKPEHLRSSNLILLGNSENNRLIEGLYARYQTAVDAVFPGIGGHEVRTISDPWGTGRDAVVLGGSDAKGVSDATEDFLTRLEKAGKTTLPPTLSIVLGPDAQKRFGSTFSDVPKDYVDQQIKAGKNALATGAHTGVTSQLANLGLKYAWTGKRSYAEAFKAIAYLMYDFYLSKPDTYGGPWGMDADFTLYQLIPAWDAVEESDALTDEDRLKITKILYEFTTTDVARKAAGVVGNRHVRFNHQTFPALGLLYAADYFGKYYNLSEAEDWMSIADECFQVQSDSTKSHEDCNGYQWLTNGHTLRYCLAKPDFRMFENGNARKVADYSIIGMDNLGYQATYGDVGGPFGWFSEYVPLKAAEWFYKDGRYQWVIERKRGLRATNNLCDFETTHKTVEPTDLAHPIAWPLEPMYYDTFGEEGRPSADKCVDKVVFRSSFDPKDQYLLLDGLSNGGHRHYDGNSIVRLTQNGRIWLADCDYIKSLPKFHNGVLIFKDGQSQTIPSYTELEHFADFPTSAFSTTTLRNYAGVDWHRHIVWQKEKYFVVIDQMEAKDANRYDFRCLWRGLGKTNVTDRGLDLEQKEGERFHIQTVPGHQFKLQDDAEYGRNYSVYQYCDPVVRNFQILASPTLKAGETFNHVSVLYGENDARRLKLKVDSLGQNTYLISGDVTAMVGVESLRRPNPGKDSGPTQQVTRLPGGLEIAAAQFHITAQHASLVGATLFRWTIGGKKVEFKSATPTDVDINFTTGKAEGKQATPVSGLKAGMEPLVANALGDMYTSVLPPAASASTSQTKAPALQKAWSFKEQLDNYLLSGNSGQFEAADLGAMIVATPAPSAANCFSGQPQTPKDISRLVDGGTANTENCVMWDDDVPVVVTMDLKKPCQLTKVIVKAWFATSSSKGRIFQLGQLLGEASNDGFRQDVRKVIELGDTKTYNSWGDPVPYKFENLNCEAAQLRLTLTPRKGTGIYISELEVWGNRTGLAEEFAKKGKTGMPSHIFQSLATADLNGDGAAEIIAGSTNGKVYAIDAQGKLLWNFVTNGPVHAVAADDLDGDGKVEVIAGSDDTCVYVLDSSGKERWRFDVPYYKRKGIVRVVFTTDLEGDGKKEVIAGADSWRYYALDCNGKEKWHVESVHGSTAGCAADLDGDGKSEVVCGTEYYWWPCAGSDGKVRWSYSTRTGPKCNSVCAADVNGDGKKEVIFGGADTNISVVGYDGKLLWQYNTGDEVTHVLAADLDGDGKAEVIASSLSFNVYALKGDGTRLWRCDLGDGVTRIASLGSRIVAGTENGRVVMLSAEGKVVGSHDAGSEVVALTPIPSSAAQRSVVVSTKGGELLTLH